VPERAHPAEEPFAAPDDLERELPAGLLGAEERSVSRKLYERLGDEDTARLDQLLRDSPDFRGFLAATNDPNVLRTLALHCAMWYSVGSVAKETGLSTEQPPEDVHAMARGPLAAAGGLYEADLVADAVLSAGGDVSRAERALDFGCSSGRVVRVLAAAYPEVAWVGCDPNQGAIEWASEHLRPVQFFVSKDEPPLPLADGSLGLAFGISIWSHFEPQLGLVWFEEMRRLLRPGGLLVVTTHGLTSVAYDVGHGLRAPGQGAEIAEALYRRGWWFASEFGHQGDWGVVNPAWGTTFLSPEWLLNELCPRWKIAEFSSGRNAGNQDVYVLERV
jgi:SAM-dependent methyltransferase